MSDFLMWSSAFGRTAIFSTSFYFTETDSHENGCSTSSEMFATTSESRIERKKGLKSSLAGSSKGSLKMESHSHMYTAEMEEVDGRPRKLLMFHGIILRSQLTVLLKNKVFFDENDGVS